MSSSHQATHTDVDAGSREIAEFLSVNGSGIFGYSHVPISGTDLGVVICSPIHAEFLRNYRREVLIGRRLCAAGVAVQRFHYRGHGNSDGTVLDATLDTMIEDAVSAAEHLIHEAEITRIAFFGTRLGALVAAAAARRFGRPPMVFWDPVVDPEPYFRDILRAHQIQKMKSRNNGGPKEDLFRDLERSGSIDVLGYVITHSLYLSTLGHNLEGEVGREPTPMLVVRLGQDRRSHHGLSDLVEHWETKGFEIDDLSIGPTEAWWFTAGALLAKEALTEPVDASVDWLVRLMARSEVDA